MPKQNLRACDAERKYRCEANKKRKVREMKGAGAVFDGSERGKVRENEINTNRILDKNGGRTTTEGTRTKKGQELFFLSLSPACLCYLPPFFKADYFSFVLNPVEYFRHLLSYKGTWVFGMSFGVLHRASPAQKHAAIVGFQEMPSHLPGYSIPVQI